MNVVKSLARLRPAARQFQTSSVSRKRTFEEFKELQRQMQVDDGVPVYLKKGPVDKILFTSICIAEAVLFVYAMVTLKKIIYPPPPS